jgi:hypothetical protein
MDQVAYLRSQRARLVAVWQQFLLVYKHDTKDVYAFFEGRDDKLVYLPELRRRHIDKGTVFGIICDGKDGVISAYQRVRKQVTNKRRILFFVDKDIDDLLGGHGKRIPKSKSFYVTEHYSLENSLATENMFLAIWSYLWMLDETDSRLIDARYNLRIALGKFWAMTRPVMAWVIVHRTRGSSVNLNNLTINHFVTLDGNCELRKSRNRVSTFDRLCQVTTSTNMWRSVRAVTRQLLALPPKSYIRGKLELAFFVRWLSCLESSLRASGRTDPVPNPRVGICTANVFELLSRYLEHPREYYQFLDYNLSRI